MKRPITYLLLAAGVLLMSNARAWACAVCQGDPDSELVKGAEAGVILLAVVTYGLLMGFAGFFVTCIVRARRQA